MKRFNLIAWNSANNAHGWSERKTALRWVAIAGFLTFLLFQYNCDFRGSNPYEDPDYTISMHHPKIAMDGDGGAVIVYEHEYINSNDTGGYVLKGTSFDGIFVQGEELMPVVSYSARYMPDYDHTNCYVAANASGITAAVWADDYIYVDTYHYIGFFSNFFVPGTGWLGQQDIYSDMRGLVGGPHLTFNIADAPTVAVGPDNDSIVTLHRRIIDTTEFDVGTLRYDFATSSWPMLPSYIGSTPMWSIPVIAMDGSGNAIVAWEGLPEGDDGGILAKYYNASAGTWESEIQIGSYGSYPKITLNSSGDGVIAWHIDGVENVHVNRYSSIGGWLGEEHISDPMPHSGPAVAVDGSGNLVVVWRSSGDLFANRYLVSEGAWQGVESITGSSIQGPLMAAMLPGGSAVVVWEYEAQVYGSRYQDGSGWSTQLIGPGSEEYRAMNPYVAADAVRAVAAWDLGIPESSQIVRQIETFQWGSPYALFLWSPQVPVAGDTVTFDASTSRDDEGAIVSYEWDFENNGSIDAVGMTTETVYAAAGTVSVRLVVTDSEGNWDEKIHDIYIGTGAPTAFFTYTPSTVSAADTVSFDASGSWDNGTILFYEWDFENDGMVDAVGQIVNYRFPEAGTYTVLLRVIDDDTLEGERTRDVEVGPGIPIPDFTWSPPAPVAGDTVTFDASNSIDYDGTIISYEWDFDNDGLTDATGETTNHVFTIPDSYSVSLLVTDNDTWSSALVQNVNVSSAAGSDYTLDVTSYGEDTASGEINSEPLGIECPDDCTQTYAYGTTVSLMAFPDGGSAFEGWAGASICDEEGLNSCTVFMDEDKSIIGIFVEE